jgi:hypothetical protein
MGLFSAIGSLFGPVGTVFGALADTRNAKKQIERQNAAAEAAYQRQLAQDAKNRELAKQDASNKFTDMKAAAEKAGINPLTALRATGGVGFGMYGGMTAVAPVLSKFNFAETFGNNLGTDFFGQFKNKKTQIEKQIKTAGTFVKSDVIKTELMTAQVSPKNWYGLTKEVQRQLANAENITAQAKIDGAVDTVAKFKFGGFNFEGSGLFGAMPSYEETLGELGSTVMAPVLATDAFMATASRGAKKNAKAWPSKSGRGKITNVYKIHGNDRYLGVMPPLSKKYFTTGGVTTEGYAN